MNQGQPIRVLIVDTHALIRGGLRYYLQGAADIVVVGEAVSESAALELLGLLAPDVVLVNVLAPDLAGVAIARHLCQHNPRARVLVIGNSSDGEIVQRVLRSGAVGYLQADHTGDELAAAVSQAHTGQTVLAPTLARALVQWSEQPPKPEARLSGREAEVLQLMAGGLSNEQIAAQLAISRNTVRHHVHHILTKLGAVNRTAAVGLAVLHQKDD